MIEPLNFGSAYANMRRRLRYMRPILTELLGLANVAGRAILGRAVDEWTVVGNVNVSPELSRIERLEASRGAADTYAGAVVLILNDMLQILISEYQEVGGGGDPGARIAAQYTIADVLRATSNNFRHYEEWRRTRSPTAKQCESIKPIAAAMMLALPEDCSTHPFGNIVAWFVLDKIVQGDYAKLESLVREFAYSLVRERGLENDPHVRWIQAEDGTP